MEETKTRRLKNHGGKTEKSIDASQPTSQNAKISTVLQLSPTESNLLIQSILKSVRALADRALQNKTNHSVVLDPNIDLQVSPFPITLDTDMLNFATTSSSCINFPNLPCEVREIIWTKMIQQIGSRIVEIFWEQHKLYPRLLANTSPPAALHVCRQSRALALKRFDLLLIDEKPIQAQKRVKNAACHARIDATTDTIYIPWSCTRRYGLMQVALFNERLFSEDARGRLQHLAIHCKMYARILKTFTIVLDGARPSHNCENGVCEEIWRTEVSEKEFVEGAKEKEWICDEWVKEVAKQLKGEAMFWKALNYTLPDIKVKILA